MNPNENSPENTKNQNKEIQDVLNLIKRLNDTFQYEVYVPSLKRNVMFRELNTSQQKRLVKSIVDSPIYNTEFIMTFRDIIKENCADNTIDIDTLNIIDKISIAIIMRSISIGDTLELDLVCSNESCKNQIKRGISLKKLYDNFISINVDLSKQIMDDKKRFCVDCSVPTLGDEYASEEIRKNNINRNINININNISEIRNMIGNIFINEICKYIDTLIVNNIDNPDESMKINFNELPFDKRILIVEKLPEAFAKKIPEYINSITTEIKNKTSMEFECEKCHTKNTWTLEINNDFFIPS